MRSDGFHRAGRACPTSRMLFRATVTIGCSCRNRSFGCFLLLLCRPCFQTVLLPINAITALLGIPIVGCGYLAHQIRYSMMGYDFPVATASELCSARGAGSHHRKRQTDSSIGRNGIGTTLLRAITCRTEPLCRYAGQILLDGHNAAICGSQRQEHWHFVTTERTRIANLKCEDVAGHRPRTLCTNWIEGCRRPTGDRYAVARLGRHGGLCGTHDGQDVGRRVPAHHDCTGALAQDTPIILLDEPTSFLDMPNRYELYATAGTAGA